MGKNIAGRQQQEEASDGRRRPSGRRREMGSRCAWSTRVTERASVGQREGSDPNWANEWEVRHSSNASHLRSTPNTTRTISYINLRHGLPSSILSPLPLLPPHLPPPSPLPQMPSATMPESSSAIHEASLIDASLHSPAVLQLTHLKMSRALIGKFFIVSSHLFQRSPLTTHP